MDNPQLALGETMTQLELAILEIESASDPEDALNLAMLKLNELEMMSQLFEAHQAELALHLVRGLLRATATGDLAPGSHSVDLLLESIGLLWQILATNQQAPQREAQRPAQSIGPRPTTTERQPKNEGKKEVRTTLKVDSAQLDAILRLFGELVMRYAILSQEGASGPVTEMGKLVDALQREMESLRTLSLKPTFLKMKRLVADTAAKLDKPIQFQTEGEDLALDKQVIEQISDPLVHLLRNACDHGLERPEDRQAQGKPAAGCLSLKARKQGDFALIQIEDDGKGLDIEGIREKAVAKGLLPGDSIPNQAEVIDCIFQPGFSTAQQVSGVSGRGVGMDVVKRRITQAGGDISIETESGLGSRFTLRLPLKNQLNGIFMGILLEAGEYLCSLPVGCVKEVLDWKRYQTRLLSNHTFPYQEGFLPVLDMGQAFGRRGPSGEDALVIESESRRRCVLVVDRVLGEQQVVSRRFNSFVHHLSANRYVYGIGYSGKNMTLVLDAERITGPTLN